MPPVQKLYQDYKGKGLEVLLIDFREAPDKVRQTVKERGYVAPVLIDESGDVTGKVYGVWGPPTVYIVDRQGRLVGRATGPKPWIVQRDASLSKPSWPPQRRPDRPVGRSIANFRTPMLRCYPTSVAIPTG